MSQSVPRRTLVVAGLIGRADGRILLTRRRPDQPLPDQWEFPGGKVEPGEAPEPALARELLEEIGARVEIGRVWDVLHHQPAPEREILMLVYACRLSAGQEPRCLEVAELAWVAPSELGHFDILRADQPLVERLALEGPPPFCRGVI